MVDGPRLSKVWSTSSDQTLTPFGLAEFFPTQPVRIVLKKFAFLSTASDTIIFAEHKNCACPTRQTV